MSCVINYNNKTYSLEDFKNVLLQEPSLLKEVANKSQEKLKAIQEIFNQNPELSKIGDVFSYAIYLDTIFPDSKVKDIVYHGSPSKHSVFKVIDENAREERFRHVGAMFTSDKKYTKAFGDNIYNVVLNIENPVVLSDNMGINSTFVATQYFSKWKNQNKDGVIGHDALLDLDNISEGIEYVVFEPEQIHILGSKQDIEGFKEFVNKLKSGQTKNQNAPDGLPPIDRTSTDCQ